MPCPYANPSPRPLSIERFRHLHPDGRQLVQQWFGRAIDENANQQGSQFEAFIFLWFSFNGFASCVTGIDRDSEIIRKVGNCPDLRGKFDNLRNSDGSFSSTVEAFAESWPIFKVQDLRRLGLLHSGYSERTDLVKHYFTVPGASHEPECFEYHSARGELTPRDWPHALQAIYRVRCNLFHGEKSPSAEIDRRIVHQAFAVLASFMERARLLSP